MTDETFEVHGPARSIEIKHADGTAKRIEGDDAERWHAAVTEALVFAHKRTGFAMPDPDWSTWEVEWNDE